jgi:hypothetical protein
MQMRGNHLKVDFFFLTIFESRDVNFIRKWESPWNCPVWGSKDGEFFPVGMGMKEKIPPKKVWG